MDMAPDVSLEKESYSFIRHYSAAKSVGFVR